MASARPRPTTLADIAAATGLSLSTVSRVLNRRKLHERLSAETTARVRAAAARLGYQPHLGAQALATRRSRTIGIAVHLPGSDEAPVLAGAYLGEIAGRAEVFFRSRDHDLLFLNAADAARLPERCAAKFRGGQIDGVLAAGNTPAATLRRLEREGIPAVAVDYPGPADAGSHVGLDNRGAVALVLDHLAALGHRRIAFLGRRGPGVHGDAAVRRRAFAEGIARRGLAASAPFADWPEPGIEGDEAAGAWAAQRIASLPHRRRPTALLAMSDETAFDLQRRLAGAGVDCPRDLSLAAFENGPAARLAAPALTVVDHNLRAITERACAVLLDRIERRHAGLRAAPPVREKVAGTLVVRESTGPAPRD